ncbi:SelB C-terminal domain-containing protein [Thermocrinis minervae]|uniref:Elongation factor SelB, winged helix n=1 Tax=Thermocrinis minervae TaxID=381751 RepID=A0A1M6R297_9AQUI|nr:SelB C-terminal domain-containing protein [Thermocrinis minervae]SHK26520.1 Elongation factor SelB, winged helix [Thermocrinis minervae]
MNLLKEQIREYKELYDYKDILSYAVRKGYVHSLGNYLYISDGLLRDYVKRLKELGETFSVQDAKSVLGLSRKYLIPLLEYLDRTGIIRREGDVRRFVKGFML